MYDEMSTRLERAARAAETVRKMQRLLKEMQERSHELLRDPIKEGAEFHHAIKHADDALQTLWVHLHYLSAETPAEK